MKYSFMSFSCPELGIDEILSAAKRYDYDGVELRTAANHKHGLELDADANMRHEIKQKIADSGITLCCVATSCKYADPETTERQVDETLRYIDLAKDVGAARIRVFGGAIPEGTSREKAISLLTTSMQSVADHAAQRGITVCVETHDHWCDPAHIAEVMKRVNHPAIGVNWDIMHPVRVAGSTIDDAFNTLKPWIRHVHLHDGVTENGKSVLKPIGQGIVNHKRAVELLKSIQYDGFLSGEWIEWEPYDVHLPRELATMKRFEQETA